MRRVWLVSSVLAISATTLVARQGQVFRGGTQTVAVWATVIGGDGRLVTSLTRNDFEVFDNGRRQVLTEFDNGIQPISIVVMLDMSGSMLGNLGVLRNAAVQMFTRLLPQDKARVGNFGDRITLSPTFTNDMNTLIRALWLDLRPGGPTPLWGAVNVAMTALAHLDGRRVVLVLTDGKDTGSLSPFAQRTVTLDDVVKRAEAEQFMVYAIGMRSRAWAGARGGRSRRGRGGDEPDPGLRELAAESGGGYFELHATDDLGPTFARVADELHRQYLLGFAAPELDGKLHTIEVRVRQSDLTVRARRSYLAPKKLRARTED